jgi:sucrose-6-phosphate hydrolase SacC (GH32 family)
LSTRHAGCEYITGAFDGGGFTALDTDFRAVDSGHDFYAAQTWWRGDLAAGPRPDAMWIAWVSHWAYSDHIQTVGWSGVLSLPRRVRLVRAAHLYGDEAPRLAQEPVESLRSARGPARTAAGGTIDVSDLEAFEIEIETDGSRPCRLSIECADAGRVQIEVTAERLTIDRSPCDMGDLNRRAELITRAPRPPHAAAAPLPGPARVIVDRSVIESFADGGLTVTTDLFLPTTPPQWVELQAGSGARLRVYPLQRTMRPHTR